MDDVIPDRVYTKITKIYCMNFCTTVYNSKNPAYKDYMIPEKVYTKKSQILLYELLYNSKKSSFMYFAKKKKMTK